MDVSRQLALIIDVILLGCFNVYVFGALGLLTLKIQYPGMAKPPVFLWAFHLFKWPALAGLLLDPVSQLYIWHYYSTGSIVADALGLTFWFLFRNLGDDDWWGKRKKKMSDKVKVQGQKLVLVPEPA